MKPPAMKPYVSVNFRENDGEKLPEKLKVAFEPRDVTLYFAIMARSKKQFLNYYEGFVRLLGSGWLRVYLPELDKTFTMYYQSCTEYSQLTTFESGQVGARFKVKLREPQPTI
ncbi:hypothetical protein [Parabacteroides sp. PF5-9]|uniref:hypothetical protein n=1 Tax=Parabacteroides sp. PF5-9 TaxID=1742404 RepID=UPI0024765457|nr:hypothetical protein [Parabacteroides sp. PF5-9]